MMCDKTLHATKTELLSTDLGLAAPSRHDTIETPLAGDAENARHENVAQI